MKTHKTLFKVLLFSLPFVLSACSHLPTNGTATDQHQETRTMEQAMPTDIATIDHITVLQTASDMQYTLPEDKVTALFQHLSTAQYDEQRNKSGIMINMIAPDKTLTVDYKDGKTSDWLMLWQKSGKVKFRNVWYDLDNETMNQVITLLTKQG